MVSSNDRVPVTIYHHLLLLTIKKKDHYFDLFRTNKLFYFNFLCVYPQQRGSEVKRRSLNRRGVYVCKRKVWSRRHLKSGKACKYLLQCLYVLVV